MNICIVHRHQHSDCEKNNQKASPCHPLVSLDKLPGYCGNDLERNADILGQ